MTRKVVLMVSGAVLAVAAASAWQAGFGQTAPGGAGASAAPATGPRGFGAFGRGGRGRGFAPIADPNAALTDLAPVATASTDFVSGDQTLEALNDGVWMGGRGARGPVLHYGNWGNNAATHWVEYTWSQPISTNKVDVLWYVDGRDIHLPAASRVKYWNGTGFVEVPNAKGLGVEANRFNETTFDEITTTRIRLEMDTDRTQPGTPATGITEFRVFDSGKSPAFPPMVKAGRDRVAVEQGRTFLTGTVRELSRGADAGAGVTLNWSKASGPGEVTFENAESATTTATFGQAGDYVLKLTAARGELSNSSTVNVKVEAAAPAAALQTVPTLTYKVDSPLWSPRIKAQIVDWIPHVVDYLEHPEKHPARGGRMGGGGRGPSIMGAGGIDNFIEAAKKLAGQPAARQQGYVFANAFVYNTLEAMCVAQMVDPQGDAEIAKAQADLRAKIDEWIPIILAAQEPDGYIQTAHTLDGWPRWTPQSRGNHEGYTQGYFLEAAIADYTMTGGKDRRLYDAAKKCADCWYNNIGPAPKQAWFDGHQEMEQALVRFGRLVDQVEGAGKGEKYIQLAKFLLDNRNGGSDYDQSARPVIEQYEAVGHAVRAAYTYSGMADVVAETHNLDYQSATLSLWDDLVNRKLYLTGGIGSGETSEGFGPDYSLRNNSYCESCSNCGELFFQHNMNLAYQDAKYVNLYEDTLYNAILGDCNLQGTLFEYTNPLDSSAPREAWDGCPCCVGNIPRTLLQLPTWTYATGGDSLYVNLFIGSTMRIPDVQGTTVEMVQKTNYPWDGAVSLTVNPAEPKHFALRIRVPNRDDSALYTATPEADGLTGLTVNGAAVANPTIEKGYVVLARDWKAGDEVAFQVPLKVQRVKALDKVAADHGRVALRYGPLIYNVESVDGNNMDGVLAPSAPLTATWTPGLLDGVVVIKGQYADGSALMAIPNYARNNRGPGRTMVWLRDE